MRAGYGPQSRLRNAALATLFAILVLAPRLSEAASLRLLVLGDSLTAGYGLSHEEGFQAQLQAALRAEGEDIQILDAAVSGDTTAGGRARLDWALADEPEAAIVELGANDGLRGIDPRITEANLTAILDTLGARHIPVLLSGTYAPPNFGPEYGREFRAVFDRLSKRRGIIYDAFFLEGVARDPAFNQPDGIHPTAAGVKRIVGRLLPLVNRLITEARGRAEARGQ
jgi:acyl-CoA thioesterase-1